MAPIDDREYPSSDREELHSTFQRQASTDWVEYFIYIVDKALDNKDRRKLLCSLQSAGRRLCKELLRDYVWQCEGFDLALEQNNGIYCLHGYTTIADSVEDEWLIVFLLLELTKQQASAWVRVSDVDGEFLLAEAADVIPKWLSPEVAGNRVWINQDRLLVIPTRDPKGDGDVRVSLREAQALEFLELRPDAVLHLKRVEALAFHRARRYPAQIPCNIHHAKAVVPRTLALLLYQNPAYISSAAESFFSRDPKGSRLLQNEDLNRLSFVSGDLVELPVCMTRVTFARLRSEKFQAPKTWQQLTHDCQQIKTASDKSLELGLKIVCGFRILLLSRQNQDHRVVRETMCFLNDLETGQEVLPSNEQIAGWSLSEDDETWLDIDYKDFEDELNSAGKNYKDSSFGDPNTHKDLQRLVSRFHDLLEDDSEGFARVGDDEEGEDDCESCDSLSGESGKSSNGEREEEAFTELMRHMMGMSKGAMSELRGSRMEETDLR